MRGHRQAEDESAQVDAQDRLTSCGQRQYDYDALGRTIASHQCGQSTTYHYNDFGQMDRVSLPNGDQLTYHYNAQGQRAGKDRNGKPEWRLLYEGPRAIAKIGADGKILDVYHYALQAHSPDFMSRDGHTYQFIKDYLGTVTDVIDVDAEQQGLASLSQSKTYDSWGWVQSDSSPGFQPFGYAGGIEDPDTHLTRFGARDYHAIEGRWLSKDPIGFAGGDSNLYGYVGGDPVNGFDPSGLARTTVDAAIQRAIARGDLEELESLIEALETEGRLLSAAEREAMKQACGKNMPKDVNKIANMLNRTRNEIERAIEKVKQESLHRNGPKKNPDMRVDPKGNVYPQTPNGIGDPIGNLYEFM